MKHNKLFRILAIAIILCLLVIAIPATPALAQSLTLSPTSGPAGTTVTVNGVGFSVYANLTVYIFFNYSYIVGASISSGGTFSTSFTVPSTYTTAITVPVIVQSTFVYTLGNDIATASFNVTATAIVISPSSGYVGSTVTINGTGFAASSPVRFYLDNIDITTDVSATTTNTNGSFTNTTLTIPPSYRGSHTIKAQDGSGNYDTVTVTVLSKITATPASGAVGDTVTINGTGFAAISGITFYFDTLSVSAGTTTTNANGSFTNTTFTIPLSSRGSHTIKAQDASGNYATATFTIGPKITITPTTGSSGTTVTVSGTGFNASTPITIKYNAAPVSTSPAAINTDTTGSFTVTFNVPAGLAGTRSVEATDGTYSANADFVATADATISQTTTEASPGYVGMELTITGTGFKPNANVTITYTTAPVVLATVTTDGNGAFSVAVTIPASVGGNHTIIITDGYTTKQFTFIMESEAPPAPAPLLPEEGIKSKAETYLDWQDVADTSGVSYTLQIASDADFTTIVLKKTGLTSSEYTLTEEEKLEPVSKKEPYYWRVKAIDDASNESQWSTPASFYVGFLFTMPSWGIYLLFGLGALLFGIFGFWLGRRTAYY